MKKRTRTRTRRVQTAKKFFTPKVIMISSSIFAVIMFFIIFALFNLSSQKMLNGVSINGISISGLTIDEARTRLNEVMQERIHKGINLSYKDQEYVFELNELNIEYNFEKQLQEAYKVGRSGNIVQDNFTILKMMFAHSNFEFDVTYNNDLLNRQIGYLELQLPDRAVESTYYIEDNKLIIVKGLDGVIIDEEKIKNVINAHLANLQADYKEEVPVKTKQVEKLSISNIHDEIYKKPENAYYTLSPFEIHPHVVGVDFAISNDDIEKILAQDDFDYVIPLKYTIPDVTIENLDIDAFPNMLGQFETRYTVANANKANNMQIAISKINGVILKPRREIFV